MSIIKKIIHLIFRTRQFNNQSIKKFAANIKHKKILEIGSGKLLKKEYHYSAKQFFDASNDFIQSDIEESYGHQVVDVVRMYYTNKFDIILCMNVLEHVYDFHVAIENVYQGLKIDGVAIFFVPVMYPLHDEPGDYWRFTEHSLKKLLIKFKEVEIKHSGFRQYPFAYYIEAYK